MREVEGAVFEGREVVGREQPSKQTDGDLQKERWSSSSSPSRERAKMRADLESVELDVDVKRQRLGDPVSSALVLILQTHHQKRVQRIHDGILEKKSPLSGVRWTLWSRDSTHSDASRHGDVGPLPGDGMVVV